PSARRDSSSSTSYQASGGKPAALSSASTAASTACCARTSRVQARMTASDGRRAGMAAIRHTYQTLQIDARAFTWMQVHLSGGPKEVPMDKLTLISHDLCPYVQRAVIALSEKGVPFDRVYIDLNAKPDWFLAISPLGKVPLLKVGDHVIFESA